MKKLNQNGLALTAMMIAVGVLLAAGIIGWYVLSERATQPATEPSAAPSAQKTSDPSEKGKYLVIKEWGVRITLPEKLRGDAYYEYSDNSIEHISLRSKQLDKITANCPSKGFYLYGGLSRGKSKLSVETYPLSPDEVAFKQVGNYWYDTFDSGNEVSSTYECTNSTDVSKAKDEYKTALGGAEAIGSILRTVELVPENDM